MNSIGTKWTCDARTRAPCDVVLDDEGDEDIVVCAIELSEPAHGREVRHVELRVEPVRLHVYGVVETVVVRKSYVCHRPALKLSDVVPDLPGKDGLQVF